MVKNESPLQVPNACYQRVFEMDPDGTKIFEELAILFGGSLSYVQGDTHATAFNEGARSVVLYIQNRIDQAMSNSKGE
jgi:hypothetical protein